MAGSDIDIFISYARVDMQFVDRLERDLQEAGYTTWVDRQKLQGGQIWRREIEMAIERSHIIIVVVTPPAMASFNVRIEIDYAISEHKQVLLLELQPSLILMELRPFRAVSFNGAYSDGLQNLLALLRVASSTEPAMTTVKDVVKGRHRSSISRRSWLIGISSILIIGTVLSLLAIRILHPTSATTRNSVPLAITSGPGGNLWFTDAITNKIGIITPSGSIRRLSVPTIDPKQGGIGIGGITSGPDGNLWFTESLANKIGRITPDGAITEFSIPTKNCIPGRITNGPDGNLWFTEFQGGPTTDKIGRITPTGHITEFVIPSGGNGPDAITTGPDGNLWFTEFATSKIGRITPSGIIREFSIPAGYNDLGGITRGPDGNLWFTEPARNKVGRMTLSGIVREFPLPTQMSSPNAITSGLDGNLWFTEINASKIGRITPSGIIREFSIPTQASVPSDITSGPDGNIWFTDQNNKIGRITLSGAIHEFVVIP